MNPLSQEVRLIQNPGMGALLLWEFCLSYAENTPDSLSAPIPLTFMVLPILLHADTRQNVESTQGASGLRTFAEKFSRPSENKRDALIALNARCAHWKDLSLAALQVGVACKLFSVDVANAVLVTAPRERIPRVPQAIRQLTRASAKLGRWMASMSLSEIQATLKVWL